MTVAAVVCALLIPHVNINTNMVVYLPDSSPMKQGMDLLEAELPGMGAQMEEFGTIFADGNALMPSDLPKTLALGVALLFVVLLIMSSSVMEVLLFMVTVGYAVILNMGTNTLLPSVSMLTNTLTSVLQMVLSMDYSIILMNRFRQEKQRGKLPAAAMETAVGQASASILSSAFTTIVSLLMLCFIKMKIGADLGIVLAKGVAISLICNFTVLPSLILWGDRGVEATRKKVPVLPASPLARFQERFRIPIAILFLGVFITFTLLQRRTQLTFSPQWESTATDAHIQGNAVMLLYATEEEDAIPALLDSIGRDPQVRQCVSYPSLIKRPRTIQELRSLADGLTEEPLPEIPEDLLQLVYYAQSHPRRTERMSMQELQETAEELAARGMIPEGRFNPEQLMKTLLPKAPAQPASPSKPLPEPLPEPIPEPVAEPAFEPEPAETPPADTLAAEVPVSQAPFTYEQATLPRTAAEMAAFSGQDIGQVSTLYRLAGKRRGTMTPKEFVRFVRENILSKRLYAAFIPKGTAEQLAAFEKDLDAVIAAGPQVQPAEPVLMAQADTAAIAVPADTLSLPAPVQEEPVEAAIVEPEPEPEPTPQERLLDMVLSGQRYSAAQMHAALSAAGIPLTREEMDLLYLYAGARKEFDPRTAIAPGALLDYLADTLLLNPALSGMVPDSARTLVLEARDQLLSQVGMLRGKNYSAAAILSDYQPESETTFLYVQQIRTLAQKTLEKPHYWIGESPMYKELKDGFPREVLLLTLLTALSIFLIVALTFRSFLVPFPLVMAVLAGVYANIWASGLGGNTLYYLAYLIVQGILMGATIDYSILFTSYYLSARQSAGRKTALEVAYKGSSHSILTSGLILAIVPYVMSVSISDAMIAAILSSLAIGASAILIIILFLLPGVLAAIDPLIRKS